MPACVSCALGQGWLGLPDVNSVEKDKSTVPPPKLKPKRSQWSKGIAPGEYGGPPIDMKPAKMWGKAVVHPLEDKEEYIWNLKWQPFFDEKPVAPTPKKEESSSGFLSFSRVMEIDRVDVDITEHLRKPVEATGSVSSEPEDVETTAKRWRYAPTRGERKKWKQNKRAMVALRDEEAEETHEADRDELTSLQQSTVRRERENYKRLKDNLQLFTLGIGVGGTACAFVVYSPNVALSYGIGLLGSLAYIRMLGNSVDSFGSSGLKKAASGAAGQPRLLVPLILTMVFNRWNELLVPEYGVTQLQLIPMLVGFFTYKIATVAQVVQDEILLPMKQASKEP